MKPLETFVAILGVQGRSVLIDGLGTISAASQHSPTMPETYESEATVYVDTSSALRPLLGDLTVNNDMLTEVDQVTSSMLGRPLLEQVARDTGLLNEATPRDEIDELISSMRNRIQIQNNPRIDRKLYTIRYQHGSAQAAKAVVASGLEEYPSLPDALADQGGRVQAVSHIDHQALEARGALVRTAVLPCSRGCSISFWGCACPT